MTHKTRYARSGGVSIAYQVVGDGPLDLVFVPGFVSNVEAGWEIPAFARFLNRLASFSRLILFDKRGTGLSDPVAEVPSLDQRILDVRAVMAAAGSERAALFGISEGGPMSLLLAARDPGRITHLILYGTTPRFTHAPDFEWGYGVEANNRLLELTEAHWGEGVMMGMFLPSMQKDSAIREAWGRFQRAGASPSMARGVMAALQSIDVREVLPEIKQPTLVLHRTGDRTVPIESARYMAERIPGARFVELPGIDHVAFFSDSSDIVDEMEEFLTGARHGAEAERVLATILFTDIVGSTDKAHELGDRQWRDLLDRYYAAVRAALARFGGREIDTSGDGFFTSFDRPQRAIESARAMRDAVRALGLEVRTGVHSGECEVMGEKLGGLAVHIGARVMAEAGPGEILVSGTVKDMLAGSKFSFQDRGTHALKGVPGEWRLYAVADQEA